MSKRKLRDLTMVFFGGLFLLSFEPVFLWLLAGALILFQPDTKQGEDQALGRKDIMKEIRQDAQRFRVTLPLQMARRALMVQVYRHYATARDKYPHLRSEYREVINEMWESLAQDPSPDHWDQVVSSVLAEWPKQSRSTTHSVGEKLQRVKDLSQQWDEAKSEALGGARV
jgi:hypothetical protein